MFSIYLFVEKAYPRVFWSGSWQEMDGALKGVHLKGV